MFCNLSTSSSFHAHLSPLSTLSQILLKPILNTVLKLNNFLRVKTKIITEHSCVLPLFLHINKLKVDKISSLLNLKTIRLFICLKKFILRRANLEHLHTCACASCSFPYTIQYRIRNVSIYVLLHYVISIHIYRDKHKMYGLLFRNP